MVLHVCLEEKLERINSTRGTFYSLPYVKHETWYRLISDFYLVLSFHILSSVVYFFLPKLNMDFRELASKFADWVGNSENCQGDGERIRTVQCSSSNTETQLVHEVSDKFYVDKSVREYELPEHVVKDICVDDGVPCKDDVLFEMLADEFKIDKTCSYPEKEQTSELVQDVVNTSACRPDGKKHLDNNESDDQCNSKYSVRSGNVEDSAEDKNAKYRFEGTTSPVIATFEQSGKSKDCLTDKASYDNNKEATSSVNVSISAKVSERNPDTHESNEHREQCTQSPNDEAILGSLSVSNSKGPGNTAEEAELATDESSATAETEAITPANNLVCNQAARNGSSTSNRDISTPASNSGVEHPRNDLRELLEYENASKTGGGPSDQWLVSNRVPNCNGETSFSVNGAISGRISYSGSIPYSGSVSIRSDSSTTSARSFAFPVAQSEWNSSPVRMAKAERKHLRKHRRWKKAILCCRF